MPFGATFSDLVEKFIPPKKGRMHVLRVVREILTFQPKHRGTDVGAALRTLTDVITKRATVFLFSDFIDKGYEKLLKIAHKKHDVVAVVIEDTTEKSFPTLSSAIEIEDAETGERMVFGAGKGFRERFHKGWEERKILRDRTFASVGLDAIELETGRPYLGPLVRFFKDREKRKR